MLMSDDQTNEILNGIKRDFDKINQVKIVLNYKTKKLIIEQ